VTLETLTLLPVKVWVVLKIRVLMQTDDSQSFHGRRYYTLHTTDPSTLSCLENLKVSTTSLLLKVTSPPEFLSHLPSFHRVR
jgi:hypothetical protein